MADGMEFAEFRLAGGDSSDWYLLVGRDSLAPGIWRSGWMVHLRQSKLAQNRMLQQARLVELGGMASALSHELKQPLFTISLCAENGRLLLDQESDEGVGRARGKRFLALAGEHRIEFDVETDGLADEPADHTQGNKDKA